MSPPPSVPTSQPSGSPCDHAAIQAFWSCNWQSKALLEVFIIPGVLSGCWDFPTAFGEILLHTHYFKTVGNPIPFQRQKTQPLTEVSTLKLFACRISCAVQITLISLPVFL